MACSLATHDLLTSLHITLSWNDIILVFTYGLQTNNECSVFAQICVKSGSISTNTRPYNIDDKYNQRNQSNNAVRRIINYCTPSHFSQDDIKICYLAEISDSTISGHQSGHRIIPLLHYQALFWKQLLSVPKPPLDKCCEHAKMGVNSVMVGRHRPIEQRQHERRRRCVCAPACMPVGSYACVHAWCIYYIR